MFQSARYSPLSLLVYFQQYHVAVDATIPIGLASCETTPCDAARSRRAAEDVTTTFRYLNYAHLGQLAYATRVQIEK